MTLRSKKVILFIVEGPTDENTLSPILKKLFQNAQVRFHVVHGDISSDSSIDNANAVNAVNSCIKREMDIYGFMRSDIIRVIHLIDTDGALIPNDHVVQGNVEKLQYEKDRIVARQVTRTIKRNERKQCFLRRLYSRKTINNIPYMVYYFSRNMEHVLHNISNDLTDEQKIEYADQFADAYLDNPEMFIKFLSDSDFAVPGDYGETWHFIFDGTNSLHRHSNMHLLFLDTSK